MWTVAQLGADLAAGRTSSRDLVEQALGRIADSRGEGARAFLQVNAESARAEADFADRLRKRGVRRSPVDGLPISVKDLFDVAGDVTRRDPGSSRRIRRRAEGRAGDCPVAGRGRGVHRPHQHGSNSLSAASG